MKEYQKIGPLTMYEIEAKELCQGDIVMLDEREKPWNRHRLVLVIRTYRCGKNLEFQNVDLDGCGTEDPDDPDPLQGFTWKSDTKLYILRASN